MIKQVKIFRESNSEELERRVNEFCVDFFQEEVSNIEIIPPQSTESLDEWIAYVVYQKDEYAEDDS